MQSLPISAGNTGHSARDAFLQRVDKEIDLPAMASAVARVVQLASSDDQAIQDLTYFVLSDVALTQKILRLANTVKYRTVAGGQITTVSRAIFLLGFETVKTSALAMMLVERLSNATHSSAVRAELLKAMRASVIGREMVKNSKRPGAEEAAIAALFANIGKIMVAAYDYEHYLEIKELAKSAEMTEEKAAVKVLGYGYETIAHSILKNWNMPDAILHAIVPWPPGTVSPAKKPSEWMRQMASFSMEANRLMSGNAEYAGKRLVERFGEALNIDEEKLSGLMKTVESEIETLAEIMGLHEAREEEGDPPPDAEDILGQLLMAPEKASVPVAAESRYPSGKPIHARDLLLQGVQQVMQMTAAGEHKVNDIMLLVLETLFNSMGFRFATICVKDVKSNVYQARIALGHDLARYKAGFNFSINGKNDLFSLSMESNADLIISDTADVKIHELLPSWHRSLLPDARSFMILPIIINQKAFGCFYGDRVFPSPEGVPADEAALIKMLKSQILSTLKKI